MEVTPQTESSGEEKTNKEEEEEKEEVQKLLKQVYSHFREGKK